MFQYAVESSSRRECALSLSRNSLSLATERNLKFTGLCILLCRYKLQCYVYVRDAGSVSAPIQSFSVDRISVRRDLSKSDVVHILFCAVV